MKISQSDWLRALAVQPPQQLSATLDSLSLNWTIAPKQLTQTGLAALKLRDGAFNDPFFIGEIPLSSAWIVVTTETGECYEGAAQLMDDSAQKIEQLALCDAILSHQLSGWESIYALVEKGMQMIDQERALRKKLLVKTTVDFALLNASEDDDDEV
ncbi:MAG: phosphonate C-P lyase system protein PhnG [Methyloprofundus sp.]|nr:phosphonate C-P lyase system protein PhnG [Methyloprofundus sp.]